MPVTSVRELFRGRDGHVGDDLGDVRIFRVTTNSATDTAQTVLGSGMVPRRGDLHHQNTALSCKRVQCRNEDHGAYHWIVTCEYDNKAFGGGLPTLSQPAQVNPLLRQSIIEGKTIVVRKARTKGRVIAVRRLDSWAGGAGLSMPTIEKGLVTSASEPFEGLEEDVALWVVSVTWNVSTIPFWVFDYQGTINSGDMTIRGYPNPAPRWSVMLKNFTHSNLLEETTPSGIKIPYYQVKFELHYKRDLWVTPILDAGFVKLDAGAQKEILLSDYTKPAARVPLDGSGAVLSSPTSTTVLYHWVADGPEKDFSVFNLSI